MAMQQPQPSPVLFFDTANAYQRSAALRAAIELDLFTAIGEGRSDPQAIAERCEASVRGVRILCDYLCVLGFLTKEHNRYRLTQDSAVLLDKNSPAYMGSAIDFLLAPMLMQGFENLTEAVRNGGTPHAGTIAPEHPIWVKFARGMAPMMSMPAQLTTALVPVEEGRKLKVLDIAAGHGMYGITLAQQNKNAEVVAVDWPNVLEVAKENAEKFGVLDRYTTRPGSAFEVEFGTDYDVVLITNFLHHFDAETNEKLLRKIHAALADGGRAVTVEFVPEEDRISPPTSAMFSLVMLAGTPRGDAYTFSEFEEMFKRAGFARNELHQLAPATQQVIISYK